MRGLRRGERRILGTVGLGAAAANSGVVLRDSSRESGVGGRSAMIWTGVMRRTGRHCACCACCGCCGGGNSKELIAENDCRLMGREGRNDEPSSRP